MRLLHTGDWHVGRTIFRRSRFDESVEVLREVFDIACDGKVDAVLVCGDVFDHHAPSPEAEQVVYEGLVHFKEAAIPVIVLAGNHDNPRRWQALRPLFGAFDVTVIHDVRRPDQGGIVELPSKDGSSSVQVACLPWVGERRVVGAAELMGLAGEEYQNYAAELARLIGALCQPFSTTKCRVFAGHLFVSGAAVGTSERQLTIGDLFAIAPQALPGGANYVALGHVHRPQRIPGASVPARYAGSLLQLDFGEVSQDKSVCLVDLDPKRPAKIEEITLTGGRTLKDLRGTLQELARQVDGVGNSYLRVYLACERPQAGLADQVREILPNAVEVRLEYDRDDTVASGVDLKQLTPRELLTRYLTERDGVSPDAKLLDLFERLLDEVTA